MDNAVLADLFTHAFSIVLKAKPGVLFILWVKKLNSIL
jgi:hypothetical protein